MNLAVEWLDWDWPGTHKDGSNVRDGLLLSIAPSVAAGRHVHLGYILTRRKSHDPFVAGRIRRVGDYPNIILGVETSKLIVKGVHIPFQP